MGNIEKIGAEETENFNKHYKIVTTEKTEIHYEIEHIIEENNRKITMLSSSIKNLNDANTIFKDKIVKILIIQEENKSKIEIEKGKIKEMLSNTLSSNNNINIGDINAKISSLSQANDGIDMQIEGINQMIKDNTNQINGYYNEIEANKREIKHLSYMLMLNSFKNPNNNTFEGELQTNNKDINEIIKSYKNDNIDKKLLDRIIMLKGDSYTGKHTAIKVLGKQLKRPIFTIKYDDYFSDKGLYSIFLTLIEYLREERNYKNDTIMYYNICKNNLEKIDKYKKNIRDNKDNNKEPLILENDNGNKFKYTFNADKINEQIQGLKMIEEEKIRQVKLSIEEREESCILCIDDLDKIISFSKFEKGDLLSPIRNIIRDIREENLDIMLVMIGNNLGNNHEYLKSQIDKVVLFEGIKDNYNKIFKDILTEYKNKYGLDIDIEKIDIPDFDDKFKNFKFINDVTKELTKRLKLSNEEISQDDINDIISKIINYKIKSHEALNDKIGM